MGRGTGLIDGGTRLLSLVFGIGLADAPAFVPENPERGDDPDAGSDTDGETDPFAPGPEVERSREQGDERRADHDSDHERELHDSPVVDAVGVGLLDARWHERYYRWPALECRVSRVAPCRLIRN